jgi:CRISPR-associated endonuclease Csn1
LNDFNGNIKTTASFLKSDKPTVNYGRKLGSVDYFIEPKRQKVELWKAFYIPSTIIEENIRERVAQSIAETAGNLEKALDRFCELANIPDRNDALNMRVDVLAKNIVATKKVAIGQDFTHDKIDGMPDRNLAKILHAHLETFQIEGKTGPDIAFEGEGLEALFKVLGKRIGKVSVYEVVGEKYPVNMKAVESERGANLFMAIYEKIGEPGVRECESIPLRDVLQAKAAGDGSFVEYKEGHRYFLLSPNDLVYLPDERESVDDMEWRKGRQKIAAKIYKLVSVNKGQAFFVPQTMSKAIIDKIEFGPLNKLEKALDGKRMVKQHCIKLKVNRLGHVLPA